MESALRLSADLSINQSRTARVSTSLPTTSPRSDSFVALRILITQAVQYRKSSGIPVAVYIEQAEAARLQQRDFAFHDRYRQTLTYAERPAPRSLSTQNQSTFTNRFAGDHIHTLLYTSRPLLRLATHRDYCLQPQCPLGFGAVGESGQPPSARFPMLTSSLLRRLDLLRRSGK